MQQVFWSFLIHSGCITPIHVLIPLTNTFMFDEEDRKSGPQRSKEKMKALGKA